MRPKFILSLLLVAGLVLGGARFLKQRLGGTSTPPPMAGAPVAPVESNPVAGAAPASEPAPAPVAASTADPLTPEQRQAAIDAETDRLQEWSMNDDASSLSNIVADLASPEKDIREAAIEATKQFGSTNAIPALKAAAEATMDLEEKTACLEAAEFLSLPSISSDNVLPPLTPEQIQANQQQGIDRKNRHSRPSQPTGD